MELHQAHARFAIGVAIVLYALFGLFDHWLNPGSPIPALIARGCVVLIGVGVLLFTFTRAFDRHPQVPLAVAGIAAGLGLVVIVGLQPEEVLEHYATGLILVIFGCFLFLGMSFFSSLITNVVTVTGYNVLLLSGIREATLTTLSLNTYLFASLLLGGLAAYTLERQRRLAYAWQTILLLERNRHARLALHDPLTGLPNRLQMQRQLERALARANRHGTRGAGLFIDVDRFKAVNDSFGHEAGDRVLKKIGERLQSCVRQSDIVSRFGGDEFFILLEEFDNGCYVETVAGRIVRAMNMPFSLNESGEGAPQVSVGASIGICEFPGTSTAPEEIIRMADQAMYVVKNGGRNGYSRHLPNGPEPPVFPLEIKEEYPVTDA